MNPFRRIVSLFRRRPGMVGTPPSAREVPSDAGLHALNFAARYAEPMDYHAANRMMELGIPEGMIGSSDRDRGIRHAAFMPHETTGGGNGPGGRFTVDSGVFNPELHNDLGPEVSSRWSRSRLRDRMDAIIAHEYAECLGAGHDEAVERASETELPIRDEARDLLRAIAKGGHPR